MKRFLSRLGALMAALCLAVSSASANSWGLEGGLLDVVSKTKDWSEYSALEEIRANRDRTVSTCYSDVAVMNSRYHNILMVTATGEDDRTHFLLYSATTAVYQPEDGRDKELRLNAVGEHGFSIAYDGEEYVYALGDDASATYAKPRLTSASLDGFRLEHAGNPFDENMLQGTDAAGSAIWMDSWRLSSEDGAAVNVRLMPRSTEEIRRLNRVSRILNNWSCLSGRSYVQGQKGGATVPVYAAPDENAWRAAKGKAAMSLKGGYTVLGTEGAWTVVSYQVSQRTSRIGYVQSSLLGQETNTADPFVHVPGVTLQATYLTDDPEVSQFHQAELAAGAQLTLLGWFSPFYAYAETTVDGKAFRGFVPLRDVDVLLPAADAAMMAQAVGTWAFEAGGGYMQADRLTLNADGTFVATDFLDDGSVDVTGRWSIHPYDKAWNRFWAGDAYQMLFEMDDGRAVCCNLALTETELGLTDEEGGGSFVRVTDPASFPGSDEDTGGANG